MRRNRGPLTIDLKSLAVSRFPLVCESLRGGRIVYSRDGRLWIANGRTLQVIAPPGKPWPGGKPVREIELLNPPLPAERPRYVAAERLKYLWDDPGVREPRILDPGDGCLYYVGRYWYRIKPDVAPRPNGLRCRPTRDRPALSPSHATTA